MRSIYILILLFFSLNSFGQQLREGRSNTQIGQDKITQIKIAKLTSDMRMTKTQAQKFWPIYIRLQLVLLPKKRRELNLLKDLKAK